MENELKISAFAISAKGKGMNLDNIYVNGRYLAPGSEEPQVCISKTSHVDFQMYGVCDGENAEDVALKNSPSVLVMQRLQQLQSVLSMDGSISRDKIWSFLCDTNNKIREYQSALGSEGVNSTFAGLFLHKNRGLAVHLGDSRIYVIRGGRMLQITEDHLEATDLYKFGILTQEQAEVHKLDSRPTATLGMFDIYDAESQVFSKYFVFYPGDIFILCTDGITDSVSNQEIERIVRAAKDAPKETIAQQLLQLAKDKNEDDKSIIVLEVEEVNGEATAEPVKKAEPAVKVEHLPEEPAAQEAAEPVKKSGFGASLAAFAAKVGGSEEVETPSEKQPSALDKLRQKAQQKQAEAPVKEPQEVDNDEDEEDEDELTILDKIFGNPKLIFGILAGIIAIILVIVLLTSLGGRKNPSQNNSSSTSQVSSVQDSAAVSVPEIGTNSQADSSAADSSVPNSTPENSSVPENSVPNSTPENSSVPENSSKEESSTSGGSSSTTGVATHTVASGDSLYDILLKYYGEFSDSLLNSFCKYNGMTSDSMIQPGDVLKIPPYDDLT